MKKLALIAALLSTNVLANWDDPNVPFSTRSNVYKTVKVTWIPVDDVSKTCADEGRKRLKDFSSRNWVPVSDACSFWSGNECTVYTKRNPTMHDIGHEVRHCFQHDWH